MITQVKEVKYRCAFS